jgi:hypothetical protein
MTSVPTGGATPAKDAPALSPNEVVDRNLAAVAKTLSAVFTTVAGAGTALGFTQEKLLAAVNTYTLLFVGVAALALIAVGLTIWSLFQGSDLTGNRNQGWMLGGGVAAYLLALLVAIGAVASYATGNGRPTITNLSAVPGSSVKVNFAVQANGVSGKRKVVVKAQGFRIDGTPVKAEPMYQSVLPPDDNGKVEQKIEVVWEQGEIARLTIIADQDGDRQISATCDAYVASKEKLTCLSIKLPAAK